MTCWVESSLSSHLLPKFGEIVPCESEDKTFLNCRVTTQLKCQVTVWGDFPRPKSLPCYV